MAKGKGRNTKPVKVVKATAAQSESNTKKIIAIIVGVIAIIALLLGLTCCNKDTDPKKLQGKVIKDKDKKEEDKKNKEKEEVKDVVLYYDNIAEITPAKMAFTPARAIQSDTNVAEADTTAPVARASYSTTEPTNEDVVITIVASEEIQGVDGWTLSDDKLSLTKTVSENEDGTVTITDLAGNTTDVEYSVQNIDNIAPTGEVSYSDQLPTLGSVVITIVASEEIQEVEDWTLAEDGVTLTKEVTANEEGTVTITDLVGNTTDIEYKVANIGVTTVTPVSSQMGQWTFTSYTVDITFGEEVSGVSPAQGWQQEIAWTQSEDKKTITRTNFMPGWNSSSFDVNVNVTNEIGTASLSQTITIE